MRRVALISSSYDPYPGGVEEHTRNVARELRARGHAVEVWTVDRGEQLGTRTVDGITVHYLPTPLPSASLRGVLSFARAAVPAWSAWRRVLRGFRPDVLHVQCFGPNGVYAWALQRTTGIPLVLSSHGETFMDENDVFNHSRLLSGTLVRALRSADAVTGCSGMVLDDLRERFRLSGGVVVPNGVDLDEPARVGVGPDAEGITADGPVVLAIGRAVRVKGFDLLLRAFAKANRPAGTSLVIGGDGPELPGLKILADELGVGGSVSFTGRLDRTQVVRTMAAADLIVVPSRIEAFGIVILEAWRSGTALLATDCGGPRDLIRDGHNGRLIDPQDETRFAAVLTELLADATQRQRLADEGLRSVQNFSWEHTARAYEDVYSALAAHEGSEPSGKTPSQ